MLLTSRSLFQRPLILVAHQDDETLGCGILMQRTDKHVILHCTDGGYAPDANRKGFASIEAYSTARFQETACALQYVGPTCLFRTSGIRDQELFLSLHSAWISIMTVIREQPPTSIVTHAYEGGHVDHDCCAFLANCAGHVLNLPVLEMPLYHLDDNVVRYQEFLDESVTEFELVPSEQEKTKKDKMLDCYLTQQPVIKWFAPTKYCERFRLQPKYAFAAPPRKGVPNFDVPRKLPVQTVLEHFQSFAAALAATGARVVFDKTASHI